MWVEFVVYGWWVRLGSLFRPCMSFKMAWSLVGCDIRKVLIFCLAGCWVCGKSTDFQVAEVRRLDSVVWFYAWIRYFVCRFAASSISLGFRLGEVWEQVLGGVWVEGYSLYLGLIGDFMFSGSGGFVMGDGYGETGIWVDFGSLH